MADDPVDEEKNPVPEEEPAVIPNRKAKRRWRIFGWGVIGAMILLIIANLAGFVKPDLNKAAMIFFVAAYLVYVIFRRR